MDYRDALRASRGRDNFRSDVLGARREACPQKKGTILRIFIPAGAEINVLNIFEISSPSGICIIVRLPFLKKLCGCSDNDIAGLFDSIKQAGGCIELG
ncbi:MAG TPA: hypothetical protein VIL89_00940 [Clostridia bacterium]